MGNNIFLAWNLSLIDDAPVESFHTQTQGPDTQQFNHYTDLKRAETRMMKVYKTLYFMLGKTKRDLYVK